MEVTHEFCAPKVCEKLYFLIKWTILVKRRNIVRFIKSQRLRWAAYVIRMHTTRIVKKSN